MHTILERIAQKHVQLQQLQAHFPPELTHNLAEWFRIALTYSSNAIEGNTLTHVETKEILEKKSIVPGKSLTEHLEALNHAEAIDFITQLAVEKTQQQLTIHDILAIHELILQKINPDQAGALRAVAVRILGSPIPVPNYLKVPALMDVLVTWLHQSTGPIATRAADAHLKLVYIHPFVDGNGRTARLLMNLLLLQHQYPLTPIRVEERARYIQAVQDAAAYITHQCTAEEFVGKTDCSNLPALQPFYQIVYEAIEDSLDHYLTAARESGLEKVA